jgi:hypothetical protein
VGNVYSNNACVKFPDAKSDFDICQLREQRRSLFFCLSSSRVESDAYQNNIHGALGCEVIHSKDYQHGTLFAIKLLKKTRVSSVEKAILKVDKIMQQANGVFTTRFTSITDTLSGKIVSFGTNEHKSNEFYRWIFSLEGHPGRSDTDVLPGVKSVFREGGAGPVDDSTYVDYEEDSEDEVEMQPGGTDAVFEEDIQTPDPKSNGKRRAEVSSIDSSKKLRHSDSDSVAGEESALEVQRLREELDGSKAEIKELKKEISAAQAKADPLVSVSLKAELMRLQTELAQSKAGKEADPCPIRIQLRNRMKEFVMHVEIKVTHVEIDLETLDEATVAFVKDAVDRHVPRLIVNETNREIYEDGFSIAAMQKKKREVSGELKAPAATTTQAKETISSTYAIANLKVLHIGTLVEKQDMEKELDESLKKSKEANVQLKKDWEYEKKQANIFRTECESMKAHIHELETMVICFCKAPYCFG